MRDLYSKVAQVLTESNNGVDTITMTTPLFIRCLEFAREDAKRDIDLHKFTENILKLNRTITSDDYDSLFNDIEKERK